MDDITWHTEQRYWRTHHPSLSISTWREDQHTTRHHQYTYTCVHLPAFSTTVHTYRRKRTSSIDTPHYSTILSITITPFDLFHRPISWISIFTITMDTKCNTRMINQRTSLLIDPSSFLSLPLLPLLSCVAFLDLSNGRHLRHNSTAPAMPEPESICRGYRYQIISFFRQQKSIHEAVLNYYFALIWPPRKYASSQHDPWSMIQYPMVGLPWDYCGVTGVACLSDFEFRIIHP